MDAFVKKRLTYVMLSGTFVLSISIFSLLHSTVVLTPLLLAELGFAVYRLGRMVSYDRVMETYRSPFVHTIPDPTGAGDTTEARGQSWRQAIGELICCPICAGTWIAAILVLGLTLVPQVMMAFVNIFCVVGIAELVNGATEFLEWNGQLARENAGSAAMAKQGARAEAQFMVPTTGTIPNPVPAVPLVLAGDGAGRAGLRLLTKVKAPPLEIP